MRKPNESGFTLLELLVSAFVLAAFASFGAAYISQNLRSQNTGREFTTRDKILQTLATAAAMDSSLRSTFRHQGDNNPLAKNAALIPCLTSNTTFALHRIPPFATARVRSFSR